MRLVKLGTLNSKSLHPKEHGPLSVLVLNVFQVSLKNVGEARSVVAACAALLRRNCQPRDIAVITPYKAQQDEIRARLEDDMLSVRLDGELFSF